MIFLFWAINELFHWLSFSCRNPRFRSLELNHRSRNRARSSLLVTLSLKFEIVRIYFLFWAINECIHVLSIDHSTDWQKILKSVRADNSTIIFTFCISTSRQYDIRFIVSCSLCTSWENTYKQLHIFIIDFSKKNTFSFITSFWLFFSVFAIQFF
jgi:hypothetical protein